MLKVTDITTSSLPTNLFAITTTRAHFPLPAFATSAIVINLTYTILCSYHLDLQILETLAIH